MIDRMPILRRYYQVKSLLQIVCHRNHRVPVWHGQSATGKEIILEIDKNERSHGSILSKETEPGKMKIRQSAGIGTNLEPAIPRCGIKVCPTEP
jgi:hypothetical protein